MKLTQLLSIITLTSVLSFSSANAANYPLCSEEGPAVTPCVESLADAKDSLIDMMLANRKGYKLLSNRHIQNGLTSFGSLDAESLRVTYLKHESLGKEGNLELNRSTTQYEVILQDCRGTDDCGPNYLWTVTETVDSDGYCYETKYTNSLIKQNELASQVSAN